MHLQEVKQAEMRITQYRKLEKLRNEIHAALTAITEDWKGVGPCDQGPFTGNTRESRLIQSMVINFTATRGGSPPVTLSIDNLHIEAYEFGQKLKIELRYKLDTIDKQMTAI